MFCSAMYSRAYGPRRPQQAPRCLRFRSLLVSEIFMELESHKTLFILYQSITHIANIENIIVGRSNVYIGEISMNFCRRFIEVAVRRWRLANQRRLYQDAVFLSDPGSQSSSSIIFDIYNCCNC